MDELYETRNRLLRKKEVASLMAFECDQEIERRKELGITT